MTEQPTSTGAKCPKCFHPAGGHYTTCADYPRGPIARDLAEFYAGPEYRAAVLTGEADEAELPWLGDIDRRHDDDVEFSDEGDG